MVSRDSNLRPDDQGDSGTNGKRPNVLLITTDQHRFDAVGFMGNQEVRTPNLDRLAERGVVFERSYVTNPVCMPSRATFLTGQFPDAHGVRRNGIEVPDSPWGIGRTFRSNGYRTGKFGKAHFSPLRRDYAPETSLHAWGEGETYYGFEERAITHDLKDYVSDVATSYYPDPTHRGPELNFTQDDYLDWLRQAHPESYILAVREGLVESEEPTAPELWTSELPVDLHQSHWIVDNTMEFIDRHADKAWFAWCSFVDPHHPFNAPRAYREIYDRDALEPPVWDDDELARRSAYHRDRSDEQHLIWQEHWREYRAQYYGMITLIDDEIGRLLGHLDELGLTEDTVVVFTADHGEMLGDHGIPRKGLFHYETLIRVPLVVSWPGTLAEGRRQEGIVQSVDVPATLLDLAGLAVPHEYQGVPLSSWTRDERDDSPRRHALVTNGGEGPHYDPWPELRTLVTDEWKLQCYVGEGVLELDNLREDPEELSPKNLEEHAADVNSLLQEMVEAGSEASVWGRHRGRW